MEEWPPNFASVVDVVHAMRRGEIPTRAEFICPACCGPARARAFERGDNVSLSVHCPCSVVEIDGGPKWPGWEVLATPPAAGHQPKALPFHPGAARGGGWPRWGRGGAPAEITPCPYCSAPLASSRARQCFVCGTDWHDPQKIVCRKNPEWNRFGLKWKEMYVVELCQDPAGRRHTRYREAGVGVPDPHRVFETPPHPGWQWVAWGHYGYAEVVRTTTGEKFTFDPHGLWLTWEEVRGLHRADRGEIRTEDVPWATGVAPVFPPE